MKKNILLSLLTICMCDMLLFAQKKGVSPAENLLVIETEYGNMKIKLYDKTPLHRDNFLKLAKEGYYDGTLFHRVIRGFMIQGGDPDSKNAPRGKALGEGGPGYTIPAEFVPEYFHKKGALAAARMGDQVNPEKESSGSQFYIVQGKVYNAQQMKLMEDRKNNERRQQLFIRFLEKPENAAYRERYDKLRQNDDKAAMRDELRSFYDEIAPVIDLEYKKTPAFHYTEEQKKAYATLGGAPHLDGAYTVFGEVVEGLDVIDKIAAVQTDVSLGNRPVKDIPMKIRVLK